MVEVVREQVQRDVRRQLGDLLVAPPRVEGSLPGGVLDGTDVGGVLAGEGEQGLELGVEVRLASFGWRSSRRW
jgi:hypothetical protein